MATFPAGFESWSLEQQHDWVIEHGEGDTLLEFLKRFGGRVYRGDEPPPEDNTPKQVLTVRMPIAMVEELTHIAGDHIEGRSGLIRTAVAEYLDRRAAHIAELKAGPANVEYVSRQEAA